MYLKLSRELTRFKKIDWHCKIKSRKWKGISRRSRIKKIWTIIKITVVTIKNHSKDYL